MNKTKLYVILSVLSIIIFSVIIPANAQKSDYKLQPIDVIKITVHEHPDLETMTRVSSDGFISFPLLGKVEVKGLTVQDVEDKLKRLLEADYLVSAQVIVFIEEYHPREVSVIGEVNEPGKYEMPEEKEMTLLEAIAMAGGFTRDADVNKTKVIREQNGHRETIGIRVKDITEKGEKEKDIKLEPDDIVIVPESFF